MLALRRTRRTPASRIFAGACTLALVMCLALTACGATPPTSNASNVARGAQGPTLVVLGASDAFGIGTYDPDRENWPMWLARDLPQPIHLVNLGIPGATLAQAQQEELPIATAQRPSILVLWLVVNDIIADVPLATYSAQLRATLATIKASSPNTHIFVGNVPDLTQLPYFDGREPVGLRAQIDAWNAEIARDCAAEGVALADLASAWGQFTEHPEYISPDGLHPSDEGARALGDFFDIVIRQNLNLPG
jgi:lysophospholipase L1-like esterase